MNCAQEKSKVCLICKKIFSKANNESKKSWEARSYCSTSCYNLSRIGKPSWNKGKKLHYEVWNKGKKGLQVAWNKGLSNWWSAGKLNHNYTGGKNEELQQIRRSPELKIWRMRVLVRDDFKCVLCGKHPSFIADHIKPFYKYPELRDKIENGRTLCAECNKEFAYNYFRDTTK